MTPTQERPLAAGDLWSARDGRRRSRPNALPRCPTCPPRGLAQRPPLETQI